jgi:hypothetical protein
VLDFDSTAATVIALVFGGGAVLAVATAWSTGIVKIIPPLLHGYADTLVTLALIVLPFAVGFSDRTTAPSSTWCSAESVCSRRWRHASNGQSRPHAQ